MSAPEAATVHCTLATWLEQGPSRATPASATSLCTASSECRTCRALLGQQSAGFSGSASVRMTEQGCRVWLCTTSRSCTGVRQQSPLPPESCKEMHSW